MKPRFSVVVPTYNREKIVGPTIDSVLAYRVHATNSIHDVEAVISGMPALIEAERKGRHLGGRSRRFARCACLGGIAQVYAEMPKTTEARGIDDFLMRRGCRVVTKPAAMWLNPASRLLLRWFFSGQYARMRGEPAPASMDADTMEDSTANSSERVNGRRTGS
jgi:hypothetical protein